MRTLFPILMASTLCAGAALAQDMPDDADHRPATDEEIAAAHRPAPPSLGFEPMVLEIGEGEELGFPRSYDQRPCPDDTVRRIFRSEVDDEFLASLRCWAVPTGKSSEFVQALDQAVPAAGWEFASGAGMGAHYTKDGKTLDILVFGFDQFGEEGETDVGYLFGVVEEGEG